MFGDMMGKLNEMKQRAEETKKRLDLITVVGEAGSGDVTVTMTGNRLVKQINISEHITSDRAQLEDMVVIAVNRALEKANSVNEAEMGSVAKDMLPNMPGMFK